jgi:hypothetical protein
MVQSGRAAHIWRRGAPRASGDEIASAGAGAEQQVLCPASAGLSRRYSNYKSFQPIVCTQHAAHHHQANGAREEKVAMKGN